MDCTTHRRAVITGARWFSARAIAMALLRARNAPREDRLHPRSRLVDAGAHRRADRRGHERRASQFLARQSRRSREDVAGRAQRGGKPRQGGRGAARSPGPEDPRRQVREPAGVELEPGAEFTITTDTSVIGDEKRVSTTYQLLPHDVKPGDQILLDDGYLSLAVTEVDGSARSSTVVVTGGVLKNNKGINLPGVEVIGARAVREGPHRHRLRAALRRRLRRAVVRAPARGRASRPSACSRSTRCRSR